MEETVQDVGLTAEYHPVIGEPVSDPSPLPAEAAPEVPAEPVAEANVIEVTGWDGRVYKTVPLDKVAQVIRDQDTYIKQFHDKQQMQQAPQPQQPVVPAVDDVEVEIRANQIRQRMEKRGFEDNPGFARFQAELAIEAERAAELAADKRFREQFQQRQAVAEYDALKSQNPELSLDNPISRYVYEQHAPRNATEHLALVKYYQSQQQAPVAPQTAPSALPQNVQNMFGQPQPRPGVARPANSAAAPQRASDPPQVARAIRETLSYLGVSPESARGQEAIKNIRDTMTPNGGVMQ